MDPERMTGRPRGVPVIAVLLVGFLVCATLLSPSAYGAPADQIAELAWLSELTVRLSSWGRHEVMGIAIWQFGAAFLLILAGLVLKKVSDYLFARRIIPLLEKTPFAIDDGLARAASAPLGYVFLLAALAGAFTVLPLPA